MRNYPKPFGLLLSFLLQLLPVIPSQPTTFKLGLILDSNSSIGQIALTSVHLAVADFYAANPNSSARLQLLTRDASADVVTAASLALELISKEKVQAILGPQSSIESGFVADLGSRAQVPIVAISATSPSVSPTYSPFFVRAAANDADQVGAIAALVGSFGWRRVVPIYEESDYGAAFIPYLVDALNDVGSRVPYRCSLPTSASSDDISAELYKLATEQTRVFVVHARVGLATRLLRLANNAGMMSEGYVWIMTSGLTSLLASVEESISPGSIDGVLGVMPYFPTTERIREFKRRWSRQFLKDNPNVGLAAATQLSSYAVWAYDAVWAIALSAERLRKVDPDFVESKNGSTDLSNLGVSRTGKRLLKEILSTEYDGLGGRFRLVDGELNVTAYRVLNVMGGRGKEIGFWTPRYGLTRRLNWSSDSQYSSSRDGLGPVIWPGESTVVPNGWIQPTSGKKLRIGVPGPVMPGFHSFLDIETDPVTNQTRASGFVIDVFEAAVRHLPYALPFEYVAATNVKYDALIQQVANGTYDAAVADITITASRSSYVDFTLPYMATAVSIAVPLRDERTKNAWVFLKPLNKDLWLVSGAFFVLTGFVVWILEHRINEEFRGEPSHQFGTVFYFTFSTLVFAHRENMVSNLSRFVVIIWVFVVLILQASYKASLTSMLTVQQPVATLNDFTELKNSGQNVGYLVDSFVKELLVNMGFDESRLKGFKSPQQFEDALAKGSRMGGIGAVVDEIPYLRVFLKLQCDNYTIVGQMNKTGGFGFAFPKGSSLVSDLSRAILNITEGDEMSEIERKWFGDQSSCSSQDDPLTSNSLSIESFWGLFLITGTASILCVLIHLAFFINQRRRDLRQAIANEKSITGKLRSITKIYDDKDLTSHTFRKKQLNDGSTQGSRDPNSSTPDHYPWSPVSTSVQTYGEVTPSIAPSSPMPVEVELASTAAGTPSHVHHIIEGRSNEINGSSQHGVLTSS
ncbi:glutamate receptor 2.8-like [Typha angustifolia]|uniref:glutamate receptor 2.8-like n=1 Tax=Typha angustifolia TaxID=59011 RepID=UPI003C2B4E26